MKQVLSGEVIRALQSLRYMLLDQWAGVCCSTSWTGEALLPGLL